MYEEGEKLSTACGSPCYAAPEMVDGKFSYSGMKTDIWSAGIVGFAMVCGILPFEDVDQTNLYKKIVFDDINYPEFLSADAISFFAGILKKDPEKRLTFEEIRVHSFMKNAQLNGEEEDEEDDINHIHEEILSAVATSFEVDPFELLEMIDQNKHNRVTATYYLAVEKHRTDRFNDASPEINEQKDDN